MPRTRVAILFGGKSEEHGVSVKSAMSVAAALDTDRYAPAWIGITRAGEWRECAEPRVDWEASAGGCAVVTPDSSIHGLLVQRGRGWDVLPVDVVLPVLHGKGGEDGAIQGLLELSGIPYVGCDIQASVVCMDKSLAYTVAAAAGLPTPIFATVHRGESVDPGSLDYPVFVKPARSGSSFGVSRVDSPALLGAAIERARRYDDRVLIEQLVEGSEVGCAVLGDGVDLQVGAVDRIVLANGFFRIHQEKTPEQGSENATIEAPASLPAPQLAAIADRAKAIYRVLGCRGLARVDMFLRPNGEIVLNEVNTFPGLTSYSRYPRMMGAVGVSLADVIDRSIELAVAR